MNALRQRRKQRNLFSSVDFSGFDEIFSKKEVSLKNKKHYIIQCMDVIEERMVCVD